MNVSMGLKWLRFGYLFALVTLSVWMVYTYRVTLSGLIGRVRIGPLAIALMLSFGLIGSNAIFWTYSLRSLGQFCAFGEVLLASSRSLLARYVPGSVWYAASRIAILRGRGVATAALTVTAVLESALSVVVVFTLGVGALAASGTLPGGPWWLIPSTGILGLVASRPIANRILRWVAGRWSDDAIEFPVRILPTLLFWMTVHWIISAITFMVFLGGFSLTEANPLAISGAFMLAWGVGFLSFIAPQGLGVFESVLASLLGVGVSGAAAAAGYRAVILVRDVLGAGGGEAIARMLKRSRPGSSERGDWPGA